MYLGKLKSTTSERCHHKRFGHVSGLVFRIVCKDRCILIYTCIHTHIYIYVLYPNICLIVYLSHDNWYPLHNRGRVLWTFGPWPSSIFVGFSSISWGKTSLRASLRWFVFHMSNQNNDFINRKKMI